MIESGTFLQQRYRIDKQIGQGGMGAVYVATDERFNSTVAIKETLCMDENFRKAIEREARLLNSLKHTALPRVSDHFEENAGQFLVMEYIQGEDLYTILERDKKPFPVETVLTWAGQLLDALDYLHTQTDPVIHRDIKPQNLKITGRGQIVLLDFGLAKGNPTDGGLNTAAKSIFGYSRNYASIEQIQGTGTDPRSDLYSLAATLYHMLTNTPPEDALTRAMSVLGRNGDPLRPADQVNPAVPAGVAGVLQKALSLNAADRPASAAEMKQMLADSEQYAYLAVPATFSGTINDPQIFAQPTQLMGDGTVGAGSPPADANTRVLPDHYSQVTAVRPGNGRGTSAGVFATEAAARPRRFSMAAATLIGILAVGAIAAGLFVWPGLMKSGGQPAVQTQQASAPPVNTAPAEDANVAAAPADVANSLPPAEPAAANASRDTTTLKQPETAGKTKSTSRSAGAADPGSEDITINDPDDPESVTITHRDKNGRLITTRVNPNVHPPNVPIDPDKFYPFPPGFDPSKQMSPEERQRLTDLVKKKVREQTPPAPTP